MISVGNGEPVKISERGSEVIDSVFKRDPSSDDRMNWGRNCGARKTNPDSVVLVSTNVTGAHLCLQQWAQRSTYGEVHFMRKSPQILWIFVSKRQRGPNWRDDARLQTWMSESLV